MNIKDILALTKLKEKFKQFLIGYVSAGHTVTIEAMDELERLTDDFLNERDTDVYFRDIVVEAYCEEMNEKLSDENKHFFGSYYDETRYIQHLENYIRRLIKKNFQRKFSKN